MSICRLNDYIYINFEESIRKVLELINEFTKFQGTRSTHKNCVSVHQK